MSINEAAACAKIPAPEPMESLLALLHGPWTLYLAWTLLKDGELRFTELRRRVPRISAKVLTERLRMLEREGIVLRRYEGSVPPRVTYQPTIRLRELNTILHGLNELAQKWYPARNASGSGI